MKKILSLVLVLSLVLGTFSFAFAATPEDVVDTDYEKAVETLMALGVVDGYPDGTYKPEKAVTRAEMAKLLIEALGYGELAEGATASFTDAQGHWAESYIGFAASMDIVIGYPDGTFKPDSVMSTDEAITMVVRALGYTDESLKGTWPTNYKVKALDLELTDGLTSLSGDGLRGNVALLLYNALELPMVEVDSDGNAAKVDPEKLFIDNIGTKVEGTAGYISYDDVYDADEALVVADGIDLEQYLYNTLTYYSTDDYDVAYVSGADYDTYEGTLVDISGTDITVEDADGEEDTFNVSGAAFFYNGKEDPATITALTTGGAVEIKVVYDADTDKAEGVVVWESQVQKIANEYTDRRPTQLDGIELPVDTDDDLDLTDLVVEGAATSLEEIEKDDVVHVYSSTWNANIRTDVPDKLKLLVVRDMFTGTLTEIDGSTLVFDGSEFSTSVYSNVSFDTNDLGEDFDLYLDKDGDIFAKATADTAAAAEGYGVFVGSKDGKLELDTDYSGTTEVAIDTEATVQIFTSEGDPVIYNVYTGGLTLGSTSPTDDLGDLVISSTTVNDSNTTGTLDLTLENGLDNKVLVKYELNSDGELTSIEVAGTKDTSYTTNSTDMTVNDYYVQDNTILFDVDGDVDDWKVVDSAFAVDATAGWLASDDDNFDIIAMTAEGGLADTGTYAVITNVADFYNGDKTVEKVTALVNGETETYETDGTPSLKSYENDVVKLTMDGSILDDADNTNVNPTPSALVKVVAANSSSLRVEDFSGNSHVFSFADGAAVYVKDVGTSSTSWTAQPVEFLRADDIVEVYLDSETDINVVVMDLDQEKVADLAIDKASVVTPTSITTSIDTVETITVKPVSLLGDSITGLSSSDFIITDDSTGDTTSYSAITETSTAGTYEVQVENSVVESVVITIQVNGVTLDTTVDFITQ